jgi:hypothetical protein
VGDSDDAPVLKCVRLLKPFVDNKASFKKKTQETPNDDDEIYTSTSENILCAEIPIDQQIYKIIEASGEEGVTQTVRLRFKKIANNLCLL